MNLVLTYCIIRQFSDKACLVVEAGDRLLAGATLCQKKPENAKIINLNRDTSKGLYIEVFWVVFRKVGFFLALD